MVSKKKTLCLSFLAIAVVGLLGYFALKQPTLKVSEPTVDYTIAQATYSVNKEHLRDKQIGYKTVYMFKLPKECMLLKIDNKSKTEAIELKTNDKIDLFEEVSVVCDNVEVMNMYFNRDFVNRWQKLDSKISSDYYQEIYKIYPDLYYSGNKELAENTIAYVTKLSDEKACGNKADDENLKHADAVNDKDLVCAAPVFATTEHNYKNHVSIYCQKDFEDICDSIVKTFHVKEIE